MQVCVVFAFLNEAFLFRCWLSYIRVVEDAIGGLIFPGVMKLPVYDSSWQFYGFRLQNGVGEKRTILCKHADRLPMDQASI